MRRFFQMLCAGQLKAQAFHTLTQKNILENIHAMLIFQHHFAFLQRACDPANGKALALGIFDLQNQVVPVFRAGNHRKGKGNIRIIRVVGIVTIQIGRMVLGFFL